MKKAARLRGGLAELSVVLAGFALDGGRGLRHVQGMKNLMLWYLPQSAIFIWGIWFGSTIEPALGGPGVAFGAVMLAAAYTGGVNLLLTLIARLRSHGGQPSGDGERLAGAGRLLGDSAQQRQRIGIDKDLR